MKKIILLAASSLLLAATASAQMMDAPPQGAVAIPPGTVVAPPSGPAPALVTAAPYCHSYTDKFTIGHEVRVTRGMACMQPDGSWLLQPSNVGMRYVQRGNGLFLVPAQPFAGVIVAPPPPVVVGGPPVVVIDNYHHHHDRDHW